MLLRREPEDTYNVLRYGPVKIIRVFFIDVYLGGYKTPRRAVSVAPAAQCHAVYTATPHVKSYLLFTCILL